MQSFRRSLNNALNGLFLLIRTERNFKIHVSLFTMVVCAGFYCQITKLEWLVIFVLSALIMSLEAINTALERTCDVVTLDLHPTIKAIKDIAAGAVLIAAIFALVIGILIFSPYIPI